MKFYADSKLPTNVKISKVITFAYLGTELVLVKNKLKDWNLITCKVTNNNDWIADIKNEAAITAGIQIDNIEVVGYFEFDDSIAPVTISFVKNVDYDWSSDNTTREKFRELEVLPILKNMLDSNELLNAYTHVLAQLKNCEIEFAMQKGNEFEDFITTQVMLFCRNKENMYCIVRDYDEDFYSLPGGGCNLGENEIDAARRELLEEAQIELINPVKIATIGVTLKKNGQIVNRIKHVRYLSEAHNIKEFEPRKDNFETVDRIFVYKNELKSKVWLLQNPSGDALIELLN